MATYYWVGGTGTWDGSSKTNWATSSGGAGGNGPPTSADTVTFDANSGTGICTTSVGAVCSLLSVNSSTLSLSLGANLSVSGATNLTLGTLSLGSSTLSCTSLNSSNSNVRTLNFDTGNVTLTGSGATIWATATVTNLTITGTPVVNCTYSGSTGTRTIQIGVALPESMAISFNISAGSDIVAMNTAFKNVNFTGFTGTFTNLGRTFYGNVTYSSGMTLSSGTATQTFAATSGTQQITTNGITLDFPLTFNGVGGTFQLQDNCTVGSTRTVTLTNGTLDLNNKTLSCGIFNSSNSNTRSIAFGTGNITLTGNNATIWTTATATGLSVTGTPVVNSTYSGSTGTRTFSINATSGTEANAISFNISAGSDTVVINNTSTLKSFNLTGFTGTLTNTVRTIYGDFVLGSGMTATAGSNTTTFAATSGTNTITTNGVTVDFPLTFNGIGGTWSFSDALTQGSTRQFLIVNGTVKLKAGATSTVGSFVTSGTNQKYLQSTTAGSRATLSQVSGTVNASYLTIKDIAATGGATWNAYRNLKNIDSGNNTGWDFLNTPVTTTTLAMRLGFGL